MFRTIALGFLSAFLLPVLSACEKTPDPVVPDPMEEENAEEQQTTMPETITITISDYSLPLKLVDNKATRALVKALREASITYEARDYGGFEKVGALGRTLPSSDTHVTTAAGDVVLYSSDQIVLFYGSNSWSYTRIGKIQYDSLDDLKEFLKAGQGDVSVTLSL